MLPTHMRAVQLVGHGGYDQLVYKEDATVPAPARAEVLIRVAAAGVNNTEINMRVGWYAADKLTGDAETGGGTNFPRIQGADCCGRIVAVGEGVDVSRVGERVIVDPTVRASGGYLGADRDGAFAEFTIASAENAYKIESSLSDIELASFPCSYSTAENLLTRSGVRTGETVLVTGASGGVGSAVVQLAKLRGAEVVALTVAEKARLLRSVGAEQTIDRHAPLVGTLGKDSVDVVIDLVGGSEWPSLLDVLKPGGRYACSGAVAGPVVALDLRTLYFKDLALFGCTVYPPAVFESLVRHLESGKVRPLVAEVFPLSRIVDAQKTFLDRKHVGKIVLRVRD